MTDVKDPSEMASADETEQLLSYLIGTLGVVVRLFSESDEDYRAELDAVEARWSAWLHVQESATLTTETIVGWYREEVRAYVESHQTSPYAGDGGH